MPFLWTAFLSGILVLLFGTSTVRATISPPGCTGSGLGISLFTDHTEVSAGDTINYSVLVFNTPFPACDATEITAEIVTPDGRTNKINLRRTSLVPGDSDFYTNVVSYVVRTQDIRPGNVLRATASDVGTIHQNTPDSRGGGFQGVDTTVGIPCINISAICVGGVGENGAITFTGSVTNCGNVPLSGVIVSNFVNGGTFVVIGPLNLATNQAASFSGSWVPLNPCVPSTATFTAVGTAAELDHPITVTAKTTTTCSETLTPGILVTKVCPPVPPGPGQPLTYTGTVSNSGDVTLTNVTVISDVPSPNTVVFSRATLAPGAVETFTASYTAPVACSSTSTLTASGSSVCGVRVSKSVTSTCPIQATPEIEVTASCPTTPLSPGGSFTITGTVRNTGDIPLVNVTVVSDLPAPNTSVFTVANLAPGASANFSKAYTVPANACSVTATFTASGKDSCSTTIVTKSVTTTCSVPTAPAIAVTLVCPTTPATAGGAITLTGTVRNSGNVTLNNVTVINNQASPSTVFTAASLAPGATANFSASFTAQADGCSLSSSVTASGTDNCSGATVSNNATATCTLGTTPKIVVTQTCPTDQAVPGGTLTFSGTVSNTGNVTVTNVVVLNNLAGTAPIFTAVTLSPGEVANFSGSFKAPTNCTVASTSTATGRSICGVAVTASASSTCTILTSPQILVTANCPTTAVSPGGTLTQTGTVKNTGNITLVNVTVVSDQPGPNTSVFTIASLAPGASANFTRAFTVPANACAVTTTFTASGKDTCTQAAVSNSVTTTCNVTTAPAIAVTLVCPTTTAAAGGTITFTGTVRNSGNVTLNNVAVVNNQASPSTVFSVGSLAPGASQNFTASFAAPADTCSISSTVTATATAACTDQAVSNTASATCALTTAPAVAITVACPPSPPAAGAVLNFTGTVRNTGNSTLTNLAVVTDRTGNAVVSTIPVLAPGASADFSGSFTVPASTTCTVTYTATVTGRDCSSKVATAKATATCPLLVRPGITVTLFCPTTPPPPGGILKYTGVVTNTGNVTLTNVVVTESQPTAGTVVLRLASLAPGASAPFSGQYTVALNCCTTANTATATAGESCTGIIVRDQTTAVCTVITSPKIAVTKTCPTNVIEPGSLLRFRGTVANTGNITLTGVTVVDNMTSEPLLGPITLAPGESVPYVGSYIAPNDFCGTDIVTASGRDLCLQTLVTNAVTTTCPVKTSPAIEVTKECPPGLTPRGGLLTYTGTVRNTGNVTLTDVFVVDNVPAANTPVIGPLRLAPGEARSFSGSFTAPTDCCQIVDTLTATGKNLCDGTRVSATATQVCYLLTTPAITVTKQCPTGSFPAGSVFTYFGTVSNTGDTALTNVFVYASEPAPNTVLRGPISLAAGESEDFMGTYTVTANSNPTGATVTATGIDDCQARTVTAKADCNGPVQLAAPKMAPLKVANGMVTITWSSTPGETYEIHYSTNITGSNWTPLKGSVTAKSTTTTRSEPIGPGQRYYRVMVLQE